MIVKVYREVIKVGGMSEGDVEENKIKILKLEKTKHSNWVKTQ